MRKFIFGIVFFVGVTVVAQDSVRVLSLEECIDIALSRNLLIKRAQNNLTGAQSNNLQAHLNYLPNLNASGNFNLIDGAFFDSNSGNFLTSSFENSNVGINSNLVIFNAFANHHLLNRRKAERNSAQYNLEDTRIATRATIIRNYLVVLLDKENLRISTQRLNLLENQFDREKKRVSVGVGALDNVYSLQSQVSTEKLNNVNLANTYRRDLLTLLQSIQFNEPNSREIQIQDLEIEELQQLTSVEEFGVILDEILNYSYGLKSAASSQVASSHFLKQTKSNRYPTVDIDAGIGSQYSSALQAEYLDQIQDARRLYLSASLSIPIFSRYNTQNRIDQARVAQLNSELDYTQALQNITNSAQSDYLDLISAQTQYETALENYEAQKSSFEFIKKRFETGNTDFYTYQESLNNKNAAEAQLANAKYTIVFRKRILDLYRGK